jgi:hypothetical protein
MGWLLELLFESVSEMCSKFIVDMMDVASGMFTEILSCDLDLFEELFGVAGDLYRNAVVPMGVALLLMILVWQLFKCRKWKTEAWGFMARVWVQGIWSWTAAEFLWRI